MSEGEESGFQVVDKRRVGRESAAGSPPDESAAAAAEAAGEASAAGGRGTAAGEAEARTRSRVVDEQGDEEGQDEGEEETEEEGDEEFEKEAAGPAMPTNVVDLVQMCLGMMNEIAWVKMGLVPDPMTGMIGADFSQARLAIDCAADLVHRLEAHVDARTHRDLQTLVQNLKMNFVRKSAAG